MRKKWFGLLAAGVLLVSCMMTGCESKTSEPPAASGAETAAGAGEKKEETEKKDAEKGEEAKSDTESSGSEKVKLVGMTWGSTATIENFTKEFSNRTRKWQRSMKWNGL